MQTIEWQVQGMTCGGCSSRLQRVLQAREGVLSADAEHDSGRVRVEYDPQQIAETQLVGAIEQAGFAVLAP